MDISARSENHKNAEVLDYSEVKVEIYYLPMKQNSYMELLDFPRFKIYSKNGSPDPDRPQTGIFL